MPGAKSDIQSDADAGAVREHPEFRSVGIEFGCDYNPEQWDPTVWFDDVRLMRELGVTLVAINVFGWALVEKSPGVFDFDQLDSVIDMLHANGIGVNLGTGTSSPPPWLTTLHPEILPSVKDGTTRWPGGRQAWCPSSPVFRTYALRLVAATAERYGNHPAVRLWHVSNELGCHNALCYCDTSALAFRRWLRERYVTVDALNAAWGTTFWSQNYGSFDEVLPPRATLSTTNPTQELDFLRFSSDEILDYYRAEADLIRTHSSAPVTTNFMITAHIRTQDYWEYAKYVDVVANDHYLDHRLADPVAELSFSDDLTRGIAGGQPWLLMEQSTSAVNWQPRNIAKAPGELVRTSLTHLARGADGIAFFQWRASTQGSEQFHSAMLPHAGTDTKVWREVTELGHVLGSVREVAGSRVVADVAIVFGWDAWWATDLDNHPSKDVRYLEQAHRAYAALRAIGATVDFVAPGADLTDYRLVVVPSLFLMSDGDAAAIEQYVSRGGNLLVTFFSGIVDEDNRVRLGGYPGALRDVLGISTEEFFPLRGDETAALDDGSLGELWSEWITLRGASAVSRYTEGPLAGLPAVTRFGSAWYAGTALDAPSFARLMLRVATEAGVSLATELAAAGGELVVRRSTEADFIFIINHSMGTITHQGISGVELITGEPVTDILDIPAGTVRVVRAPLND
ncbi:beta-galactosidase [Lacisediminihabitans sp. G11-30]|uniref:Beta-galactosidase n=2 Tax=Lacisediminihabitans changchengi TaxID=2787634 RepID=A0A934W3B6_9MICO|nr:beta-galactosidase [Lacisediminihabitans changchengi]